MWSVECGVWSSLIPSRGGALCCTRCVITSPTFPPCALLGLGSAQVLEHDHSATWICKSWDGGSLAREGIFPGSQGYAICRRSTAEQKQQEQVQE